MEIKQILKYKFNNKILMWLQYRMVVLNHNKNKLKTNKEKLSINKKIKNILKGMKYIFFQKKEIFLITSTNFNFKNKDGVYINILDDFYKGVVPNGTQIFEYPDINYQWNLPKQESFSSFIFFLELVAIIISKFLFFIKINGDNENFIKILEKQGYNNISIKKLNKYNRKTMILKIFYKYFLKITKPKLIIVNCACYGDKMGLLIKVAKDLYIKTAEIQHGLISKNHIAYNYSTEELENDDYKEYFPDYMLTYGNYWNEQMNIPSKKITIGNPYLNKVKNQINNIKRIDFLIVSQWDITEKLLNLAVNIRKKNLNSIIKFRTHPSETLTNEMIDVFNKYKIEFVVNEEKSLYEDILNSKSIVGCYTTCLIEAVAFDIKIYVLDNELSKKHIPKEIGNRVNEKFEINSNEIKSMMKGEYWASDFKQNYLNFLNTVFKGETSDFKKSFK